MSRLLADTRLALRTWRKSPGFTAIAVISIALGIGANAAIFTLVDQVLLRQLPVHHPHELVQVTFQGGNRYGSNWGDGSELSYPVYAELRDHNEVFAGMLGRFGYSFHVGHAGRTERVPGEIVTGTYFPVLGVGAALGRMLTPEDDTFPGGHPVAVISYGFWVSGFASDPGVVNSSLIINGHPYTVVGVAQPGFEGIEVGRPSRVFVPMMMKAQLTPGWNALDQRLFRWISVFARLRPGITSTQAQAGLSPYFKSLIEADLKDPDFARAAPETRQRYAANALRLIPSAQGRSGLRETLTTPLWVLMATAAGVLLIACANVANLLLARGAARQREIAVRLALGATRGRIAKQLLVESVLLAIGGLAGGCLLAYGGIAALAGFMPRQGVPWETQIRLDTPVLIFALVAAGVATLAFGLFPSFQSARRDLLAGAALGARGTAGRQQTRMRKALVIAQVALSIVLLLGAGLLMRTFVKLVNVDWGFDPKNVIEAGVGFPPGQNVSTESLRRFYRHGLERIGALPGVRSVAIANVPAPFAGMGSALQIPGKETGPQDFTGITFCSEQLFDTIGLTLMRGRLLSSADVESAHHVVVINEALARKYFNTSEPLGAAIKLPRLATLPVPVADPTFEVIGIVRDIANAGPRDPPAPQVWLAFPLRGPAGLGLVVRTSTDAARMLPAVRAEIAAVDRQVALIDPGLLDDWMQRVFFARPRFSLLVLGIFACTGIVLVAFGVYGVLAYTISQQTREIAIRMALGGERGHVVRMVLLLGLRLVGFGLVIGVAASFATNRLLQTQLWNTSPNDPITFATAIAAVSLIAVLACWVPARRAIRVEPMVALRHE